MRFATDATLGKLGRHLRAAGFDTLCQHEKQDSNFFKAVESDRIIVTRTNALLARLKHHPIIFIRYNDPFEQVVQVFQELNIRESDVRPFSRCLSCNLEIEPVDRQFMRNKVPVYIWQHHRRFRICKNCKRIFWAGSHYHRLLKKIEMIFEYKGKHIHE